LFFVTLLQRLRAAETTIIDNWGKPGDGHDHFSQARVSPFHGGQLCRCALCRSGES
jgi:hypothetical protein